VDWNHNGILQDWAAVLGFQVDLTKRDLERQPREAYELFNNIDFRKHSTAIWCPPSPTMDLLLRDTLVASEKISFPPSGIPLFWETCKNKFRPDLAPLPRASDFDETLIYYRWERAPGWTAPPFHSGQSVS